MAAAPPQVPPNLAGGLFAYSGGSTIACAIVFIVFSTIFLALRFISVTWYQRRTLTLEDWLMIPAWVILLGQCANVIISVTKGGVGHHLAWVLMYDPHALEVWAQTLFVTEFLYGSVLAIVKTSILLLYIRIFSIHRRFRWACYVLIGYVWVWALALFFTAIFQCTPVAYDWDKTLNGHCINQLVFYRWICVPNVIHDTIMLVIPIPLVWELQVNTKKRLGLTFIFVLGAFGLVASAIRLSEFWKLDAFSDDTWASVELMGWTLAEPGVIFVCACLPTLWPMIVSVFGTVKTNTKASYYNSTGSSTGGISKNLKSLRSQDDDHYIPLQHKELAKSENSSFDGAKSTMRGDSVRRDMVITVTSEDV